METSGWAVVVYFFIKFEYILILFNLLHLQYAFEFLQHVIMLTWSDLWSFLLQWAFCSLINPLSFMLTYLTDHSCRPISAREKSLSYWKINIFLHFLSCRWPQKEALRILATLFMWICVVPCWPCPARPVRQEPGLVVLETLLGLVTTVEHKSSSGPSDSHY